MVFQLTHPVVAALQEAATLTCSKNTPAIYEVLFVYCLLQDTSGYFFALCTEFSLDTQFLLHTFKNEIDRFPTSPSRYTEPKIDPRLYELLEKASSYMLQWKDSYIGSDHIFIAFFSSTYSPTQMWRKDIHISSVTSIEERITKIHMGF